MAPLKLSQKRAPGQEIAPVISYNGILYGASNKPPGGFIEARDSQTHEKLWELRVYTVPIDESLEADVQWVFITSMKRRGNRLLIDSESGKQFSVDLNTFEICRVKLWGLWKFDCSPEKPDWWPRPQQR